MEQRTKRIRQTIVPAVALFWLGLPICLALLSQNCRQIEGPLRTYVKYFSFCHPPVNTSLVVQCTNVTALLEDIIHIPKWVQALCLTGSIKQLKEQVFQAFPELCYLRLHLLQTLVISARAFVGLGTLQHLLIVHGHPGSSCINITIPPDMLLPIHSLQTLRLENICLTGQRGIMLPSRLQSLSIFFCYQIPLSEWLKIFPSLRMVSQVTLRNCRKLYSYSVRHNYNSSGQPFVTPWSLKEKIGPDGQNRSPLQSLKLQYFHLTLRDLLTLGIKELDSLSLENTAQIKENQTSSVCPLASQFSLRFLKFSQNYYKSFDGEELQACVSLESLVLQGNKMEIVDPLLLYKLPHLQLLDLSLNKLHWALCPTIYRRMNFTSRLQILDFSSNNVITTLQVEFFYCLTYLQKLSLNSCGIQRIERLAFSGLHNLKVLNLKGNNIKYLENKLFSNLSRLASLDLSGNPIEVVRKDFFHNLDMLKEISFGSLKADLDVEFSFLDLKKLQITSKSRIRFRGENISIFSTLEKLTLGCHQLTVDSCKFPLFPQMKEISLTRLHKVTVFCNGSRPFLHHFPLLENFDYKVPPRGSPWTGFNLSHLSNLRTLVIVNLGITLKDISQDDAQYLFQNLAKLEIMHLMSSGLEYISAVLFQDLKNLRLLILEDDLLLTLDSGFQNEMMLLKYLYLARVTFGCYCSNAWFVDWVSGKNDLYVAIDYELSCQELITAKKTKKFLPFVEQNCRVKINLILFIITSFLLFFLMSFPLVHACCGPQLFFLIYLLRGWWHRLCGEIGKGKKFKYDAFVSYCSQDQEWVLERLVPNLEQKGPSFLKLCLHSRDFAVGKAITDNIMDNLYNSQKTICVISQHSLCSHWCSLEMSLATYRLLAGREDTLILVFLEHISRYRLSAYHRLAKLMKKKTYLNWPKDPAAEPAFWNRLRNAIKKHCDVEESVM